MTYYNTKLPDSPWHVGYVTKDDDDPRRHKARCIHKKESICTCTMSGSFMLKCGGSSHCTEYAETEEEWKTYLEEMTTEAENCEQRALLYRLKKQHLVRTLLNDPSITKKYNLRPHMSICPFCTEKLIKNKNDNKFHCSYCGARFEISPSYTKENAKAKAELGVFLIKE